MSVGAVAQSQLLMAQALGAAADTINNSPTMQTSTASSLTALTVPSAVTGVQIYGTSTIGDGGVGLYMRSSSGSIISADGAQWALTTPTTLSANGTITGGTILATVKLLGPTCDTNNYQVNGTTVVRARITGWGTPTGTLSRATFTSDTVALTALAARVAQLIIDLETHGLIGA